MYSSKLFQKFCKDRNIKMSTRKGYKIALSKYTDFNQKSIDFLITEAIGEENDRVPLKDRKIKKRLVDFRNHLFNSDLSSNSVKTYFSKIKSFYRHFEVEMPYLPHPQYEKAYETCYFDLPTKNHIARALEISPIKLKAVILFMASSGTAKAETLSLTVKDFFDATSDYHEGGPADKILKALDKKTDIIPTFYLKRIKTDKYYYTFSSPEASDAIIKYLKTRDDLKLDDKLFDFSPSYLTAEFQKINDRLNWGFKGSFRFFRAHSLRKFHASNIGLSAEYVDALQGRSKNPIHETYIKTNPQKLKAMYESVMDNIIIYDSPKSEITQEFTIVVNVFLSGKELNIF